MNEFAWFCIGAGLGGILVGTVLVYVFAVVFPDISVRR